MNKYMIFRKDDDSFYAIDLSDENLDHHIDALEKDGCAIVCNSYEGENEVEAIKAWYEEQETQTPKYKKCPKCLADIPVGASKCQHCGSKQKGDGSWLIALAILLGVGFVISLMSPDNSSVENKKKSAVVASEDIDETPLWYNGSKPWASISKEGRMEILRMRHGFEATKMAAQAPSEVEINNTLATSGERLIIQTHKKYGIDPFYNTPGMFGPRMVVWLPDNAWATFTSEQKDSVRAYMKEKYANWGIGTGKILGSDIAADRLVEKSD